jgi:hypothetical protein
MKRFVSAPEAAVDGEMSWIRDMAFSYWALVSARLNRVFSDGELLNAIEVSISREKLRLREKYRRLFFDGSCIRQSTLQRFGALKFTVTSVSLARLMRFA